MQFDLMLDGLTIVPISGDIVSNFNCTRFLNEQKEYLNPSQEPYVMGGFGAFGNPSSYHHPDIRSLRSCIYNNMRNTIFQPMFPGKYMQMIPDRFAIRCANTSISPEQWHRDVSNVRKDGTLQGHPDDKIFGGWVNLDDAQEQYFSCVPGTHVDVVTDNQGKGFCAIPKDQGSHYKSRKKRICVPPGHALIFNERLVHEVCPNKQKKDSYRIFMKYHLTQSSDAQLFPTSLTDIAVAQQGVFPISLGQPKPPMYAKLHAVNWCDRLDAFSQNIGCNFKEKNRVCRFMPSLYEAGEELFPPWSEQERSDLKLTIL